VKDLGYIINHKRTLVLMLHPCCMFPTYTPIRHELVRGAFSELECFITSALPFITTQQWQGDFLFSSKAKTHFHYSDSDECSFIIFFNSTSHGDSTASLFGASLP